MSSSSAFWRAADAVAASSGGRVVQQFLALSWKNGEPARCCRENARSTCRANSWLAEGERRPRESKPSLRPPLLLSTTRAVPACGLQTRATRRIGALSTSARAREREREPCKPPQVAVVGGVGSPARAAAAPFPFSSCGWEAPSLSPESRPPSRRALPASATPNSPPPRNPTTTRNNLTTKN
jgi:hypothetical protein